MVDKAAIGGVQGLKIRFKFFSPFVWPQLAFGAKAVHLLGKPRILRDEFMLVSEKNEEAG